jgi:hypothetical protein
MIDIIQDSAFRDEKRITFTMFTHHFLIDVNRQQLIDYLCETVLDEVHFLITSPNTKPVDFRALPQVTADSVR